MIKKSKNPFISVDKLYRVITLLIVSSLLYAIYESSTTQNWEVLIVSIIVLFILLFPFLFEKKFNFDIPTEIEILFILFVYASLFIGKAKEFYDIFWWWDVALHSVSAIILGFIGFTIMYLLYSSHKVQARPITLALFSFIFAISIGSLWEIFEFFMDQVFGMEMQNGSLVDTMADLIIDALGALLASAIGFLYFQSKKAPPFERMINRLKRDNPHIFKE